MKVTLIFMWLTSCRICVNSSSINSCENIASKECKDNYYLVKNKILSAQPHKIFEERVSTATQSETTKYVQENPGTGYVLPPSGILNCFENATHWAKKEETTFQLAKLRHQKLHEEVLALQAYIRDYKSTTEKAFNQKKRFLKAPKIRAEVLASNGIASYRLIYRYVHMLQRLKEIMAINFLDKRLHDILWEDQVENFGDGYIYYFKRIGGGLLTDWPNIVDLALAMHSLIHIQEVYNYNYTEFPGILSPETKKPPQLKSFHCAQIGLHAMRRKHFAVAIEWIDHAINKLNIERESSISLSLLESYLQHAVKMHNVEHGPLSASGSQYYDYLFVKNVKSFQTNSHSRERVSNHLLKLQKIKKTPGYQDTFFKSTCAGEDYRTPQQLSKLNCWYDTTSSPARVIQPFKKELLSSEPEIIQVYDFVGEKIISLIVNDKTNCYGVSDDYDKSKLSDIMRIRTPTTCWPVYSRLETLWNKVSSLTSTDLRTEERSHHIASIDYLSGRFYAAHRDSLQLVKNREDAIERILVENGDRLFTLVVYLNDVPAGGWTSFAGAGTAAPPIKGSVVFWKNLHRNGSAIEDSWHGACPVIYGHKQAAVVIIRSHSQFLTHPCTLNQNE